MTLLQPPPENVEEREIQAELETSFLEYAMSVIVSRALPDARDGLKPVHRRILWGAHLMNLTPDRSYVKCGRLVGEVMGKYHPHGDVAIYDALVRMGQPFSLRHPLIDGHGNFGSPADPPAAMRYTECRLAPLAMVMLAGIDEDTVDLVANYSGEFEEPAVLPSRLPNLLVNGAQGIAVGMATNIPPHNLGEVVAAAVHLIDHPTADVDRLARIVRGPDFPTGGTIVGRDGILDAYRTGRGSIKVRAAARIEPGHRGDRIVVSELPYQVSVETVAEKIGEIVEHGGLQGVREIIDESAKGETRFVVELRPGARGEDVLAQLFKQTQLESNFAVNCVALVSGVPRTLSLRECLEAYLDHQYEVVRRRSEHRLEKARDRAHIVEGRLRVLDVLDAVIALIRASDDRPHARAQLMAEPYEFSELQASDILNMQLGSLTRLSRLELEQEIAALRLTIGQLEEILTEDAVLRRVVKEELQAVADEHATPRRTRILDSEEALAAAADLATLVADAPREVRVTTTGFVSATDPTVGGRRRSSRTYPDGPTVAVVETTESADLLLVGASGTVHRVPVRDVPVHDKPARGAPVGEPVVAAFAVAPGEAAGDAVRRADAVPGHRPGRGEAGALRRGRRALAGGHGGLAGRRRSPGGGRPPRRRRARGPGDQGRQGDPLRGRRGAGHGPAGRHHRRPQGPGGRRGHLGGRGAGRRRARRPLVGRLRQAHAVGRVPGAGPGRPGRARLPDGRQGRRRRHRLGGRARRRRRALARHRQGRHGDRADGRGAGGAARQRGRPAVGPPGPGGGGRARPRRRRPRTGRRRLARIGRGHAGRRRRRPTRRRPRRPPGGRPAVLTGYLPGP